MESGAKRPGRPGTPIALGAQPARIQIRLPRGAAISGVVRDQGGAPLPGLVVQAVPVAGFDGVVQPAATTLSDDRGAYRLFGLTPGGYVVAAFLDASAGDFAAPSVQEIDARFAEMLKPPIAAPRSDAVRAQAVRKEPMHSLSPTFYPGTPMADRAGVITLAAGGEQAADFVVSLVPAGRVEGVVTTVDGALAAGARAGLDRIGPAVAGAPGSNWFVVALAPGSPRFRFSAVTPGRYVLSARLERSADRPLLWASTEITTTGEDAAGLTLELRPARRLAGRVVFLGSPEARDVAAIRLVAAQSSPLFQRAVFASNLRQSAPAPVSIRADGSFAIEDLIPGSYSFEARATGAWRVRSAMIDGRDVMDVPLDVAATDVGGMVVTFVERLGSIDGTLTTPAGAPAADFTVVVLTTDQRLWRPGARRIRAVRPSDTGRFVIQDLPGGEYLVAALTDVDASDLGDPGFLTSIVRDAIRVNVAEAANVTQNLRIQSR
jgi:hypothetical protein